jgi:hypothetical protein
MAANINALNPRIADRKLFLAAAITFPLIVLIGYFRSYYGSFLFDVPSVANSLVHFHAGVMSAWVVYFTAQVALIRTKNVKFHMTMGLAGIALAVLVVIVGMATAYDAQLVRGAAPPGVNPHGFFILPLSDMFLFAVFFTGAVYYRKRPAEHGADADDGGRFCPGCTVSPSRRSARVYDAVGVRRSGIVSSGYPGLAYVEAWQTEQSLCGLCSSRVRRDTAADSFDGFKALARVRWLAGTVTRVINVKGRESVGNSSAAFHTNLG